MSTNTTFRLFYTTPLLYKKNFDNFETLFEIQNLLHNKNNRFERSISEFSFENFELNNITLQNIIQTNKHSMSLSTSNTFSKIFEFKNLLDIDESTIIKSKNKFRKSQNKKNIIIRVEKTTTRFTKRNFSNFEIVKTKIEIKAKRVKKNERNTTTNITNTTTQNEKNTTVRNEKRNTTNTTTRIEKRNIINTTTRTERNIRTFKITRATISIFQIIDIFNDKANDNNFNNFDASSNNKEFQISKNENEIIDNN